MGATLEQLARGLTGAVTREDAKAIAKLHGVSWQALLKAIKRRARSRPAPVDDWVQRVIREREHVRQEA